MEVEYSLGLEDLLAWNDYRDAHSPAVRRRHLAFPVFFLVLAAVTWVWAFGPVGQRLPGGWTVAGSLLALATGLFGVLLLLYPALLRYGTRRLVRAMYREGQNRAFFTRRRLTITPETLTDATEISVTTMKWVAVEKIAVDQRHAYFYVSAANALILPKAAFATAAEFNEFLEAAQGYRREGAG